MLEKVREMIKEAKVTDREVKMAIIEGVVEGKEEDIVNKLHELGVMAEEQDVIYVIDEILD